MRPMDKRMFLNIVIISIVSFYLVFGMVYRGLYEESAPDLVEQSPWEQPFLIPKGSTLKQIEFPSGTQLVISDNVWMLDKTPNEVAGLIANNWQGLIVQDVATYSQLPKGNNALVFIAEQTEPIVVRLVIEDETMALYRLNDRRVFKLPAELQSVIWVN